MTQITPEVVRQFILEHYVTQFRALGLEPGQVPESFDLLLGGVMDSLGVLELVGALETRFNCQLDMAGLDAEKMTIIGPLSEYVAANLARKP